MRLNDRQDENLDFNAFDEDTPPNANLVVSQAMEALWDMCIAPMEDNLSEDDKTLITLIGITLKMVAEKATLWEETTEEIDFPPSNNTDWSNN